MMQEGQMQHQPDAALAGVIGSCRAELSELYGVVQQEQKRKLQRWQDEEPMLECQIEALTGTRDIIQREQKQLTAELANLKALLEKQAAEAGQQAGPNTSFDAADEARLQEQLQELSSKIAQLDEELTGLVPKLSGAGGAGCKPDEVSYYETKLVVIQDTRRLLQAEATALSAEIKRRQTAARLAADRDTAAQLGLSDLRRLGERLAGVEAALDRAKVERYFPAQRGFRFSGGGGGVYCGVKDLHLSEVSGAFSISLEAVPAAGAAAAGAGAAAAAQREVRLKVTLSGIATGASSQEYKQQQQQQKQQQAAKAAAQAKSLKRQQTYQQQQQQQQQGSPLRRAQSRLAPDSPSRQQHGRPAAGPGGGGSSGGFSSGGTGSADGSKRNAAIAKFLGQLNDKKDALSNAIKTSPLSKGLEGSSSPRGGQPRALNFSTGSPGSGFTRHLAGTFGDKAAGFSQRLGQQNAAAGSSAGLLGGLAGTGLHGSSSGDLLGSACGSTDGSNAADAAASSIDGSSASMLAAADRPAAAGHSRGLSSLSTTASIESGNDFTAVKQPQPDSPTSSSSLQGPGASMDSRGSGSWPTPESPQDGQLKAKLGSMKGKLGGLLADSKQKLADSKLMQESKQKLAESKQKLADSKFISESRAAAKHLLEDSKHLFEDSKAGLKKGLSNLQDKHSHGQPGLQQQQQHPSSQGSTPQQGSTPRSSIDRQQQQQDTRQQHVQQPLPKGVLVSPSAAPEQPADAPAASAGSAAAAADLAALAAPAAASSQCSSAHDGAGPPSSSPEQKLEDAAAVAAADEDEAATAGGSSTASLAFPAVTAATAAAASTGEQERHLLDEAWVGDEQGGMHAGSGGGSSTGWLPGSGAAAAAAGVAGGKGSGSRKGVVVMLLAEGLEILGEKGTKVPNIRAAQLGLEVECVLSACLTYSSTLGWQSAGLSFEVVSLERVVEGSNIPVPKTLIKSVLNLVMPSVFTKLLLTSLPHELGQFILDSAATAAGSSATTAAGSNTKPAGGEAAPTRATAAAVAAAGGAGVWLSGELCLAGPPLACLSACLTRSAEEVPAGRVSLTNFVQELRAAQKARALLSLPDPLHARALALLFTPGSPYCLLNTPAAAAAAGGSAAVGSGSTVLGLPASLTLRELCRFYLDNSDSSAWPEICAMWQVAVGAVCLHLAREDGLLPPAAGSAVGTAGSDTVAVTHTIASGSTGAGVGAQQQQQQQQQEQFSFSFEQLLNGRVAALVRKPVRLSFGLNKLLLGLDAAAGLAAARDYCERAAREFAESAKGEDALLLLQRPLSQQLELLHLWHAAMSTYLATFLQQFKETGGRVMLAADKGSFSIAVEELTYEGPMRLQIPLPLLADLTTGACTFDLRLPHPEFAVSSLTSKLRFVSSALSKAAFGKCEQECAASRHAAAVEAAIKSGTDLPLTLLEELDALMTIWNAGTHEQQQQQLHAPAGTYTGAGSGSGIKLSRVASSNQRSGSTAAAAATASITRNSLTNAARTSSVNAGSESAPGSSPGAVPDATAAASTAAASNGDAGRDSATPAAAVGGETGNGSSAAGSGGCGGDAGSAAGGGMIGRVCMTKASAGLVLDEKRLKELMAGGGLQDAGLLGGMLACFGQLFTATIAPGWPSQQDSSLLAASMEMGGGNSGSGSGAAAEYAAAPQTIVTVRNNEVTRVKAALEAASFESAVSPRIAVRLLHMLVLATAHKFGSGSSKRLEVIHKVFTHVAEYLGRDCLDLLVCVDVAAAAVEPTPGAAAAGSGAQGSTLQQPQQGPALQLLLAGAAPGTGSGAGAGPTGGSSGSSGTGGACCYIINDVNLLTVLETVRLLMEYSS